MKYILYGAGPYMRNRIGEKEMSYFEYIVDKNPDYIGTEFLGKIIKDPETLCAEKRGEVFIVIYAFERLYDIEYNLEKMGFIRGKDFIWEQKLRNIYPNHQLWREKNSEIWQTEREVDWRNRFDIGAPYRRSELVSKMVKWEGIKTVLDLGAGQENIRPFLPEGIKYYPVDYKPLSENTIVCNFNKKEFPNLTGDLVLLMGVAVFVDEAMWLIEKAVQSVNSGGLFAMTFNYYNDWYSAYDFIKDHKDFYLEEYAFYTLKFGVFVFRKRT